MPKVNITPAMRKMASAAEMYVEYGTRTFTVGDVEHTGDTVEISEENSDFFIQYGVDRLRNLSYIVAPDYVEDLPAHITSTAQLKAVVKYAIECCQAAQ